VQRFFHDSSFRFSTDHWGKSCTAFGGDLCTAAHKGCSACSTQTLASHLRPRRAQVATCHGRPDTTKTNTQKHNSTTQTQLDVVRLVNPPPLHVATTGGRGIACTAPTKWCSSVLASRAGFNPARALLGLLPERRRFEGLCTVFSSQLISSASHARWRASRVP
jgi:hypothetical protein